MKTKVRAAQHWDVKMPPPIKHMVGGHLVVNVVAGSIGRHLMQKARRIVVEIHTPERPTNKDGGGSGGGSGVGGGRFLDNFLGGVETNRNLMKILLRGDSKKHVVPGIGSNELRTDDIIVVRIMKPGENDKEVDLRIEEDVHSVSTLGLRGADEEPDNEWVQTKQFNLTDFEILRSTKFSCEVKVGRGDETQVRLINFNSAREAKSFCDDMNALRTMHVKRLQKIAKRGNSSLTAIVHRDLPPIPKNNDFGYDSDSTPLLKTSDHRRQGDGSKISLLIDIISAVDLPVADYSSSDPFVVVFLGEEEMYRTKYIPKTIDPVWTLENGSLFLLEAPESEFFAPSEGVKFVIKDYDAMSSNDFLGQACIDQKTLLEGTGERVELKVHDEKGDHIEKAVLNMKYRKSTPADVAFMKQLTLNRESDKMGILASEAFVPPRPHSSGLFSGSSRRGQSGTEYLVLPGPDKSREQETKWMTAEQIDTESKKASLDWIEVGSGKIGKLYVELIACDGLPNNDITGKSDAFGCIVFEDNIVNTDVINNKDSPRWMPWTQRAFKFNIAHPSSPLMLGILDYDSIPTSSYHDPIGRITIDFANFSPNTEYDLWYDLYTSGSINNRKKMGMVNVRVRVEWERYRRSVISCLSAVPPSYVNVAEKNNFQAAHFAVVGEENIFSFNLTVLKSYINELKEVTVVPLYIKDAILTVLLWRGHFPIRFSLPICCKSTEQAEEGGQQEEQQQEEEEENHGSSRKCCRCISWRKIVLHLPLHSVYAFVSGILVVEDFNLLPSFMLFSVAWFFLATMELRRRDPSPWGRPRSFGGQWLCFIMGDPSAQNIAKNERKEEVEKFQEEEKEKTKKRELAASREAERKKQLQKAMDVPDGAAEFISTEKGFSINPLAPIFLPFQKILGRLCVTLRVTRNIIMWDETHITFWITNFSIFAGLLIIWIPWGLVIRWVIRILVWVLLGPWMKLVDIVFFKRQNSKVQQKKIRENRFKKKLLGIARANEARQIARENIIKLVDWKSYLFGKFVVRVPRFKEYRYKDLPLGESTAVPVQNDDIPRCSPTRKVPSQSVDGNMIPKWKTDDPTKGNGANYGSAELV